MPAEKIRVTEPKTRRKLPGFSPSKKAGFRFCQRWDANITFSERVEWARRLEQVERIKAEERMRNPTKNSSECETAERYQKVRKRKEVQANES